MKCSKCGVELTKIKGATFINFKGSKTFRAQHYRHSKGKKGKCRETQF